MSDKLLEAEKKLDKIKLGMKKSASVRRLRRLVTELRTAMGNKETLETQLARLRLPNPLFFAL